MDFSTLKKEVSIFRPLFALEKTVAHSTRKIIKTVLFYLLIVSFILASGIVFDASPLLTGMFFLILSLWLIFVALDAFYYSYRLEQGSPFLFELASILALTKDSDLVKGFASSSLGSFTLLRAGVDDGSLDSFLVGRKIVLSSDGFSLPQGDHDKPLARLYIEQLLLKDKSFESFLALHDISSETLWNTFEWVASLDKRGVENERWWSRERLSKIEPIGRSWSYGKAYGLMRFSVPLRFSLFQNEELHPQEAIMLETMLSKVSGANVIVVGEEGSGKIEVVEALARKVSSQEVSPVLQNKQFLVLSVEALLSTSTDAASFEKLFISILNEMVRAGNIILVIPDFNALVLGAQALQSDLTALLSPFLSSPEMHIVAISDLGEFHASIEKDQELLKHFETLSIKGGGESSIAKVLMEEVLSLEAAEGVFFTYPAIHEAVKSAGRYFVGSPLYDTAGDLLVEAIALVRSQKRILIEKNDILSLVRTKTGVPAGAVDDAEKQKLMRLEELLHERVVGQKEAVSSISDALRRARSGINNPNRPIGSFLFLGPTGVGKTETTKALGEIFFGQNAKILRLDMSEFNTPDALNRLIGGYGTETPGILSTMIKENQYGVLLLDEFEKTDRKVLDLFLQILDEGVFSDALGRKIGARNLIIIATSNAGSQKIFDTVKSGANLLDQKDVIIDNIVSQGIFKPELLNRFDGVILFHPLEAEHLRSVAKIMLERLVWRLKERGFSLVVNDVLINFLVEKGTDPKFGARPLNRAIQDTVEKIIADRIISGELKPGSQIEFSQNDLVSIKK